MGGLRIMPRYRIKNIKKNQFWLQKCPFKQLKIVSKNPFSPKNSSLVIYKSINYEHLDLVKK